MTLHNKAENGLQTPMMNRRTNFSMLTVKLIPSHWLHAHISNYNAGTFSWNISHFHKMIKYLSVLPCLVFCFSNVNGQNLITNSSFETGTLGANTAPTDWTTTRGDYNDPSSALNEPRPSIPTDTWIDFDGIATNNQSQDGGRALGGEHNDFFNFDLSSTNYIPDVCYTIYFEHSNPGLQTSTTTHDGDGFWRFRLADGQWANGPPISVNSTGSMQWSKASVDVTGGIGAMPELRIRAAASITGDDIYLQIDNVVLVPEGTADLGSTELNDCYIDGIVCYPETTCSARDNPGVPNTNSINCDISGGDPINLIEVPTLDCADAIPVIFDTPILPSNPSVLYHYWGNCAPLSPPMPTGIAASANGYIQQMFCEIDAFGLPAFTGGLSDENGIINFLPQQSEDVGCNGFAEVGSCTCGDSGVEELVGAELIQIDFWMAVPRIQAQVGFRFGGGRDDAGAFFVGADLNDMCEVAYFTDGQDHDAVADQNTGSFNISNQLTAECGLLWMRVRLYINDIDAAFNVIPQLNAGDGWVDIDELLIEPALSVDDNVVPIAGTTPVSGYLIEVGGEQFLYDNAGTWNPYGCDPVPSGSNSGICGDRCPVVNPIDIMDTVCDGMLGSTISDWMTSVEANLANIAAVASANTSGTIIYSMDVAPTEDAPPTAGSADASNADSACANETETTFAYLHCLGADGIIGGGNDLYLLLGTHILSVYPPAQMPADDITDCTNTPTLICADDAFGAASNPTGGASVANWDGGVYTGQAGDLAGTIDVEITTTNGCVGVVEIITPPCPGMCPDVNPIDGIDAVCDGMLGSTISDWMTSVEADLANLAAIADANTSGAIIYSMDETPTEAAPPTAVSADASHAGTGCVDETETTFAYLLCLGADIVVGGGDDIYILLGTHRRSTITSRNIAIT